MPESVLRLNINGRPYQVVAADEMTLLEVVRDRLHLHGTKDGCSAGSCGSCTLWVDGIPRLACVTLAKTVQECEIVTIEGLAGWWASLHALDAADLHPLQAAFADQGAVQCGFCTPGMIMGGAALLRDTPSPSRGEVQEALSGHLCRCTGYEQIIRAVQAAGRRMLDEP